MQNEIEQAAARLREAREHAGFEKAKAAADAFQWSYPAYKSHESGDRGFRSEDARRYADAFGVSASWLLLGEGPKVVSEDTQAAINALNGMTAEQMRQVLDFIAFTKARAA